MDNDMYNFEDVKKGTSKTPQKDNVVGTKVVARNDDSNIAVKVPVYVNYLGVEDKKNNKAFKTYLVIVSGLAFDQDVNNANYSSNDMLEDFSRRHESVYKCCLPMPRDSVKDFRKGFLETAGYLSDDNYELLSYLKCVSYHTEKGHMDILKFKFNNDWVNRRFPTYFIDVRNKYHSNADEFNIDLSIKVQDLLKDIVEKDFKFSSKGDLGKKKIEYEVFEARADLINHSDSKEYKQVKLLLACVDAIKDREHKRSSELTPTKAVKVSEETSDVTFVTINRTTGVQNTHASLDGEPPVTPNMRNETALLTNLQINGDSPGGKSLFTTELVEDGNFLQVNSGISDGKNLFKTKLSEDGNLLTKDNSTKDATKDATKHATIDADTNLSKSTTPKRKKLN